MSLSAPRRLLRLFILFLILRLAVKSENQREKIYRCSPFCTCIDIKADKTLRALCNVKGFQNRSSRFLFGANFSCINELDLSGNNLKHLQTRILRNLTQLTKLNIGFNDMRSWHGNITKDLPNLAYLNVTGNHHLLPNDEVFELPKLRKIYGVWWRKECGVCLLAREESDEIHLSNNTTNKNEKNGCKYHTQPKYKVKENDTHKNGIERHNIEDRLEEYDFPEEIEYGQLYNFYKERFIVQCEHDISCDYYERSLIWDEERFIVFKGVAHVQYLLGVFAVFINFVVMATVVARDKLRASPSFFLIGVLAASDVLTGLYSILQASFQSFIVFNQADIITSQDVLQMIHTKCNISGYIFTTAQITSPMTSLFLTVERYLVIVYGLNPDKRLTRKAALLCSLLVWVFALLIAFVPFILESVRYNGMSHCSLPNVFETEASTSVRTGVYVVMVILLIPYLFGLVLYQRMHAMVKSLGQKMGHRADSKVAKKIALIVFSNLIFFVIPTILLNIHANFYSDIEKSYLNTLIANKIYLFFFSCVPLLCFNINSCLNPFLFALRNDTFKQELKALVLGMCVRCKTKRNISTTTTKSSPKLNIRVLEGRNRFNDNNEDSKEACANESIQMENKKIKPSL